MSSYVNYIVNGNGVPIQGYSFYSLRCSRHGTDTITRWDREAEQHYSQYNQAMGQLEGNTAELNTSWQTVCSSHQEIVLKEQNIQGLLEQRGLILRTVQSATQALSRLTAPGKRDAYFKYVQQSSCASSKRGARAIRGHQRDLHDFANRQSQQVQQELEVLSSWHTNWESSCHGYEQAQTIEEIIRHIQDLNAQLKAADAAVDKASVIEELRRWQSVCSQHYDALESMDANVATWRRHLNQCCDDAVFSAQSLEENRAELSMLREGNAEEYARKSWVLGQKLLADEQFDACAQHAEEWMGAVLPGTQAESVMQMASMFICAIQSQGLALLTNTMRVGQFRDALTAWIAMDPALQLDYDPMLPRHPAIEELEVMRGHLYRMSEQSDSVEAAGCYLTCAALRPTEPLWQAQCAAIHIACAEWDLAKARIANLPPECVQPLQAQLATTQHEVYSVLANVVGWAISNGLIPQMRKRTLPGSRQERQINVAEQIFQLANQPYVQSFWIPYCMGETAKHLATQNVSPAALVSFVGQAATLVCLPPLSRWVFNRYVPNCDRRMALTRMVQNVGTSSVPIVGGVAGLFWQTANTSCVVPSITLGLSVIAQGCNVAVQYRPEMGRTQQAILITMRDTSSKTGIVMSSYMARGALQVLAKGAAAKVGMQARVATLLATLPPAAVVATAAQTALSAYQVLVSFPRARTALALRDVARHYRERRYDLANTILQNAQGWHWIWSCPKVINAYAACLDAFTQIAQMRNRPGDVSWAASAAQRLGQARSLLAISDHYSELKDDLLSQEIMLHLNTGQKEKAADLLKPLSTNSHVFGEVICRIIEHTATLEPVEVDPYLAAVEDIFPIPTYTGSDSNVGKWQGGSRKCLSGASDHCVSQGASEDTHLRGKPTQPGPTFESRAVYNATLKKYREYVVCRARFPIQVEDSPGPNAIAIQNSLDALTQAIGTNSSLARLSEILKYDALWLYVNTRQTIKFVELLQSTANSLHERLAIELTSQADNCVSQGDFVSAYRHLELLSPEETYAYRPLLLTYISYVAMQEGGINFSDRHAAIDAVLKKTRIEEIVARMHLRKLIAFVEEKKYQDANDLWSKQSLPSPTQRTVLLVLIRMAQDLLNAGQYDAACTHLEQSSKILTHLHNREVLDHYHQFLVHGTGEQFPHYAGLLIQALQPIPELQPMSEHLKHNKVISHLQRGEYTEVQTMFPLLPDGSSTLPEYVKREVLSVLMTSGLPPEKVEEVSAAFGTANEPVIKYLCEVQRLDDPSIYAEQEQVDAALTSVEGLLQALHQANLLVPSWLTSHQAALQMQKGSLYQENNNLPQALDAYRKAEHVITQRNLAECGSWLALARNMIKQLEDQ